MCNEWVKTTEFSGLVYAVWVKICGTPICVFIARFVLTMEWNPSMEIQHFHLHVLLHFGVGGKWRKYIWRCGGSAAIIINVSMCNGNIIAINLRNQIKFYSRKYSFFSLAIKKVELQIASVQCHDLNWISIDFSDSILCNCRFFIFINIHMKCYFLRGSFAAVRFIAGECDCAHNRMRHVWGGASLLELRWVV